MELLRSKKFVFIAAVVMLCVYIVPLGSYPLMEPDEGRYAEIPREMIESGNYITPMLNYVKYFEKPAFLYHINAVAFKVLGENEFAARIGTALCAVGGALATAALAAFIYGRAAGIIAGFVTATSLLYFAIGTINITDMPLSFFMTVAFAAFYVAHRKDDKKYYLLFYLSCAMALLTKGLIGIVLPGAVIFFYILATKQWKLFYKPLYIPGIILFFAVSVPWFYMVCRDNPDFFRFFFIQEHFLRYATKMHGRYEPFWFFLPMIPAGLLPWTAFLSALFSKKSVLRSPHTDEEKLGGIYLIFWFSVILIFFSFSSSKLIPYIVPCLPPLAVLIGGDAARMINDRSWHGFVLPALFVTTWLLGLTLLIYPNFSEYVTFARVWHISLKAGLALIAMPLLALYFTRRGRKDFEKAICSLIVCAIFFIWGLQGIYGIVASERTMKYVAEVIMKDVRSDDTLVSYNEVLQGLSFYTGRRVAVVGDGGELSYGASCPEGKGWFFSEEEFEKMWLDGDKDYIVVIENDGRFDSLSDKFRSGIKRRIDLGKYSILYNR
ncbi:MAG: glycosyltransferase family 39 protein [Synergistes sp.]|nr:glycosyltransferase family 39 protein [Synergistes sp.]